MASTFASSLELVRQGHIELRQSLAFGPAPHAPPQDRRPLDREPDVRRTCTSETPETEAQPPPELAERHLRILEALLFASAEPLAASDLARIWARGCDVEPLLVALQAQYAPRGVNLVTPRRQMGVPHRRRPRRFSLLREKPPTTSR